MRMPTVRGCAGALAAVLVVAAAVIAPSTLGETSPLPRIETFISTACGGGASPCPSSDRSRGLRALQSLLAQRMPALPEAQRTRLAGAIYDEAKAASLDPFFILAVIAVESGFDHVAESQRGARGLMQLRPSTLAREAERLNVDDADLDDPVLNVRAGIRYFRRLVRAFGSTDLALMAYNAGPNRILRYLEEDGDVPERFQIYPKRVEGELRRLRRTAPQERLALAEEPAPGAPGAPARARPEAAPAATR